MEPAPLASVSPRPLCSRVTPLCAAATWLGCSDIVGASVRLPEKKNYSQAAGPGGRGSQDPVPTWERAVTWVRPLSWACGMNKGWEAWPDCRVAWASLQWERGSPEGADGGPCAGSSEGRRGKGIGAT